MQQGEGGRRVASSSDGNSGADGAEDSDGNWQATQRRLSRRWGSLERRVLQFADLREHLPRPKRTRIIATALLALAVTAFLSSSGHLAPAHAANPAGLQPGDEVTALRTRTSRTIVGPGGSFRAEIFPGAIHYRDAGGDWQPIDDTLDRANNGSYQNRANRYDINLPPNLNSPVRVTNGGDWLSFALRGASAPAVVDGAHANYAAALPSTDVAYVAENDVVKELLTLRDAAAPSSFTFALQLSPGLTASETDDGIDVVDGSERTRFHLDPPFMRDASGEVSHAVTLTLSDSGTLLTLAADPAWLASPNRSWPVMIDPTVSFTSGALDCTIATAPVVQPCVASQLAVGKNGAGATSRSLIEWSSSTLHAAIPWDANVESGNVQLQLQSASTCNSVGVKMNPVTRNWTTGVSWSKYDGVNSWTTAGGDADTSATFSTTPSIGCTAGPYLWRLKRSLLQGWVDGSRANYGMLIQSSPESTVNQMQFTSQDSTDSAHWPRLLISYDPGVGDQSFFRYDSQQLSDRTSLKVNVANGNLLYEARDLALAKAGADLNLTRYWNGFHNHGSQLGKSNWSFNVGDSPHVEPILDNWGAVVVVPGQRSYIFEQSGSSYVTPAGIDATLVQNPDSSYTLTYHATDEKWRFQTLAAGDGYPHLVSVTDRNASVTSYAYDASGNWTSLTQHTNGTSAANDLVTQIGHNGLGDISTVTDPSSRVWQYAYDGSRRLSTVTDPAGKVTSYAYGASGNLSQITDPLGNATKILYNADSRVTSVTRGLNSSGNCPSGSTCPVTSFAWTARPSSASGGSTAVTDPNGHQTTYSYDNAERVTQVVDTKGNAVTTSYTDGPGSLGYNAADPRNCGTDDNVCAVKDALNNVTNSGYDATYPDNLRWTQSPLESTSNRSTYAYGDATHPYLATSVTDARGKVTTYAYDANGNTTSTTLDGTTTEQLAYNTAGQVTSSTDATNNTSTKTYDASGNLASQTDPLGDKTTYSYDGLGRRLSEVDPLGNVTGGNPAQHTTSYSYDALDRSLTTTDPLGNQTTNTYDANGNKTSVTDPSSHATSYALDALNRRVSMTAPDPDGAGSLTAPVTTYACDAAGNQLTEVDPRGNVPGGNPVAYTTTSTYDTTNLLVSVTTPLGEKTTYGYDANGNKTSTVEPRGNVQGANPADYTTAYGYDAGGQLHTETDPLGNTTTHSYDLAGNQTSLTDANNHTTSYTYDAAGRVLSVTAPDGGVTSHTFDGNGHELTRTDANSHTTAFAYDAAGQLTSVTKPDPDGAGPLPAPVTTNSYDANGNLTSSVDPNGNGTQITGDGTTSKTYDADNQLKTIAYSDSTPGVSFSYDAAGNRTAMTDGAGTVSYAYDGLDRLISTTRGSDTFSYSYDPSGNITSRTYPDATVVSYGYDANNHLSRAASGGATTSYAYDPAGNLTQTTLPATNGYVETRTYDRAGRVVEVKNAKGGSVLSDFAYTLDAIGNPTTVSQTGAVTSTTTYGYDANDRLTSACYQASCPGNSDPLIRWTYDQVGNRLTEARPTGTTSYSYNAADELTAAGSTTYGYDQNGNETAAGSRSFSYDLANRLATTTSGGTTTTYSYDGDGNRLQASTGTQAADKTNYLWDSNQSLPQLALERDGNNALLRRYIYGVRRISMTSGGGLHYYAYDGLGSVANVTASTGSTEWTYAYEPFGAIRTQTQNDPQAPTNPMRFTGEYLDSTGLYYLRAREEDPTLGSFTTVDPLPVLQGDPGRSSYEYADDRPTVLTDPSGKEADSEQRTARQRIEHAFHALIQRGMSRVVSAGFVGNFWTETEANPLYTRTGAHTAHIGIAQWDASVRWPALETFAARENRNKWGLDTQLAFVWYELHHSRASAWSTIQPTRDIDTAATRVQNLYEGASGQGTEKRKMYARRVRRDF